MKVISIINLKGGVAKTISSANVAHVLSEMHGYKVLIIDNDKQGNISKQFGCHSYDKKGTDAVMVERGIDLHTIIQHTDYNKLDIIAANMNLLRANLEVIMDQSRPQQTRFKKAFESVSSEYDFIIIDNAPDINISTINALVASDYVMVPIKIDNYSMDGMQELVDQIESTKEDLNPGLEFLGWFTTQYVNNPVNLQGETILREQHSYPYFKAHIRRTEKVDESTFCNQPLNVYSKRCGAAKDYLELVNELLSKINVSDSDTK